MQNIDLFLKTIYQYEIARNEIHCKVKLTWNLSYIDYIKKIDFQRNLNIFSPIIKLHGSSEVLVYATIEIKLKEYYLQ